MIWGLLFLVSFLSVFIFYCESPIKMGLALFFFGSLLFFFFFFFSGVSWFSLIFSLLFLGGILVIFSVVSSLLPSVFNYSYIFFFFFLFLLVIFYFAFYDFFLLVDSSSGKFLFGLGYNFFFFLSFILIYFFCFIYFITLEKFSLRFFFCRFFGIL